MLWQMLDVEADLPCLMQEECADGVDVNVAMTVEICQTMNWTRRFARLSEG